MASVQSFRRNLKDRVVEALGQYDAFVGEVAWLSDPKVLQAMEGKCLGLVTQNRKVGERIQNQYQRIICPVLPETIIGVHGKTTALGQIRKHGTYHDWGGGFQKGPKPFFMHCKALVLGDLEAHSPYFAGGEGSVHWVFRPRAVWSGSYNMTMASRRHCEHVLYVENDDELAASVAGEFWETYQLAGVSTH